MLKGEAKAEYMRRYRTPYMRRYRQACRDLVETRRDLVKVPVETPKSVETQRRDLVETQAHVVETPITPKLSVHEILRQAAQKG